MVGLFVLGIVLAIVWGLFCGLFLTMWLNLPIWLAALIGGIGGWFCVPLAKYIILG